MAEPVVTVGVQPDPAGVASFATQIEESITRGATAGGKAGGAALKASLTPAMEAFNKAASKGSAAAAAEGIGKLGTAAQAAGRQLSATAEDTLSIASRFKALSDTLVGLTAAIQRETSTMARSSIDANSEATRASNAQLIALRNSGKEAAIEAQTSGQIQVREARTSGQQRVQITREVLDTIGRLEKGLGTTLSGIARTAVGAVSKAFDGLTSIFKRSDKETFNSSSFESSLKERESVLKSSFSRQESTVRESVSKQETQLAALREQANSGVLGAANRSGLLGGLAVGFAALSAVKSTFSVGADFTRGLAVLQASLNLTGDDMKKVRQESIDLGNDITLPGVSALDAAQAIQTLTKQFGSLGPAAVTAAEQAAKGTLQLARASGASADDAAALIGSAVNVFKVNADDAVGAADKITGALTRAAGVGFTDFKDSFIQGATVFEQFVGASENANDTLLDFNTTLAILAKNGITGANAGAGLKQFFLQATSGTDKANAANAALAKRAGVTGGIFFDAAGKSRQFADSVEILRKGVVGLNDESRKETLSALFGSRSITIANALINSTGDSFATLREQIGQQGLAAKIAAAQNTGLKGAIDALQSVVETVQIVFFEKVQKPIGAAILAFTNFANTILFGAGPALHTLRIGLEGVIAGIGALIGLKAAVEVIALLGKVAALAFTPFGALVIVFGLVGAALALFNDKSKFLGEAFATIKSSVTDFVGVLEDKARPIIAKVSDFISGTAIPTATRWAGVVERDLKGAFEATVGFVRDTVIPGFQRFVGVLESDVFPKVSSVAQTIGAAVVTAKDKVVGFAKDVGDVVGPLIQPAIDGFKLLGTSLGDLVSGNFSTIGSGLASAGKGIGSAFANIGEAILPSLKTLGSTVLAFFTDLFSAKNLISAVEGIGDFLNFIGQKLGEIVSNPKVLAAVGIVAGVAAKLAFDLLSGIVEGIASNIPQLLHDAWQLAVKFAFKPEVIIGAITAALVVGPLLGVFRSFGSSVSTQFASGFTSGLKGLVGSGADFLKGLFVGSTPALNSQNALGAYKTEIQGLQNQLRILGSTTIIDPTQKSAITDATSEIGRLRTGMSDAQLAGLKLRDSISIAFRTIGGIGSGIGGIGSGLAQIPLAFGKAGAAAIKAFGDQLSFTGSKVFANIFGGESAVTEQGAGVGHSFGTALSAGLSNAKDTIVGGFKKIGESLSNASKESGRSIGSILGEGIAKGIGAAVSGIFFGQQIGNAKGGLDQGLGIAGLLGSAAALGPVAGTAALAIGGLTAAFTANDAEAKAAQARVGAYADELLGHLKDGQITATNNQLTLNSALAGNDDVVAQITKNLGTNLVNALANAGIHQSDLIDAFGKGGDAVDAFEKSTGAALLKSGASATTTSLAIAQVDRTYREFGKGVAQANAQLAFTGGNKAKDAISSVGEAARLGKTQVDDVTDSITKFAGEAARLGAHPIALVPADGVNALSGLNTQIANLQQKVNRGILPASTPSNVQPALDVATALQNITDLKTTIDAQFAKGILPPGVSQFQDTLNTALQGVQGAGTNIAAVLADNVAGNISDAIKSAKINDILKGLGDNASKLIQEGLDEGLDPATIADAVDQLKTEAERGLTDPVLIQQIEDAFANINATLKPTVDAAALAAQAAAAAAGAQIVLNGIILHVPTGVDIPIVGPEYAGEAEATISGLDIQIPTSFAPPTAPPTADIATFVQGLFGAGAGSDHGVVIPTTAAAPTIPAGFSDPLTAAGASAGTSGGAAIDQGFINGIKFGIPGVNAAATAMAQKAAAAARIALGISSPSKVFLKIGQFVISGLVKGINDGTDDVTTSVTDLVTQAVDAATGAMNDASKALRDGSSSLFSSLFGSDSVPGKASFAGIQGSITQSFNQLGSTLDDSFSKAADVLKRSATEKLSNADLDILGEQANSLNPNDVLGASNRGALTQTIDNIVGLGKSMIDQGAPAAQVTDTIRKYLAQTRALAVQYGLNGADVDSLVDSLGLSGSALDDFVATNARLAAALGTVTTNAEKLNDTVGDLFKNVTGGKQFNTIVGVGAAEDARAAVVAGASSLASAIDAVDQRAKDILDKRAAGTALTNAEQLALNQGLNNRSINLTDQLGVANRAAFEAQIANIKDLGTALLAGGSSANYVTGQINQQISALELYGASLGFNSDQIADLVNKAGLGADSLAAFNQSVADAAAVANTAAAAIANGSVTPPTPGGLPPASNAFTPPPDDAAVVRDVIVNQYLPYADPAAIALAAANGVASAVRLPV